MQGKLVKKNNCIFYMPGLRCKVKKKTCIRVIELTEDGQIVNICSFRLPFSEE